MAFPWRVDDGPTLNAGYVQLCDFSGDPDQYCIEPYIFYDFSREGGGGVRLPMREYRSFCQGGGMGSRPDCQKTALKFSLLFLILNFNILQFDRGCPMVISKKTILFQGFRGSSAFSREGGSNVVQMLISIETHITCHFRGGGGVRTPISPLDPLMLPVPLWIRA